MRPYHHRVRSLLQHPRYHDRVQYLVGSPWNPEDLRRAGAGHAQAIFVLADYAAPDTVKDQDRILLTAVSARKYLIRQYDYDPDDSDDSDDETGGGWAGAAGKSVCNALARRKSPKSAAVLSSSPSDVPPSGSHPFLARMPSNSVVSGAVAVLQRGISTLGRVAGKRSPDEADDELSERIVIQTHSTLAMEELTRGLGFRRAYCPHIIRLRLMAYGTVFPGLVSFFMNLLKGDPLHGEDLGPQAPWYRAFRAGAQQRVVRYQLDCAPNSKLKGRTFAEVGRYMYRWHAVLMVGVEVNGVFLLNPHRCFRFHPARARKVMTYFIAPGLHAVREALEALQHTHWDKMDLDHSLTTLPKVHLRSADLPPPRTALLERMQQRRPAADGAKSFSVGCLRTVSMPGGQAPPPRPPPGQDAANEVVFRRSTSASQHQDELRHEVRDNHHAILEQAHHMLSEAHEAHQNHTRQKAMRGAGATLPGASSSSKDGGEEAKEDRGNGSHEGPGPPRSLRDMGAPVQTQAVFLDSVVKKVQVAHDMLTQLLDVHHSPLPKEGLHDHIVLGLCNDEAPSADAFIQYVTAFRKLVHLPIVVLCADSERFATLLQGVRNRLRQSSRRVADEIPPDTRDIYFVKGSAKIKADLHHCCVETAYAVVLLGDDVPRHKEAGAEADPVLMDRHVLLSCFKLESILRQRLYSQVLTIVDLRYELNMDLLRQRVRPPSQRRGSRATLASYLGGEAGGEHAHLRHSASLPLGAVAVGMLDSSLTDHEEAPPPPPRRGGRRPPRPTERTAQPGEGCPLYAAGRVCCRSFFDVLFIYLYKNPYALKLWKEVIRSRLDDLAGEEFQMGSGVLVTDEDQEELEMMEAAGAVEGDLEETAVPIGYNGKELFLDTTGHEDAPPALEDLQDAIDALRSSLDEMALPPAFIGLPYGDLVDSLLHIGIVPMGLYRPRGLMEAPMRFSLVNPPAGEKLVRGDLVFVLRPNASFSQVGEDVPLPTASPPPTSVRKEV